MLYRSRKPYITYLELKNSSVGFDTTYEPNSLEIIVSPGTLKERFEDLGISNVGINTCSETAEFIKTYMTVVNGELVFNCP